MRKRVIGFQTIERIRESSRFIRKNGAGEKIGSSLRLQPFRTETGRTTIQNNAIWELLKQLAATRHEAFTCGIIQFRLPMRGQCG